jgi:hypothetical protein
MYRSVANHGDAYQISMLLGGDPEVPVTPSTQIAELLYFGMHMPYVILDGQASRVENTDVAAETPENTGDLEG